MMFSQKFCGLKKLNLVSKLLTKVEHHYINHSYLFLHVTAVSYLLKYVINVESLEV